MNFYEEVHATPPGLKAPSPHVHTPRIPTLRIVLIVLGLSVSLGPLAQIFQPAVGALFTEVVLYLGVPMAILSIVGIQPIRLAGLDSTTARGVIVGFVAGVVNYFAWGQPLMELAIRILPQRMVDASDSTRLFEHTHGLEFILVVIVATVAAPLAEEFFNRGLIQSSLIRRFGVATGLVLSAGFFSAMHLDPVSFLPLFECGIFFGLLAYVGRSIWPSIAGHSASNAVASTIYLVVGGKGPTETTEVTVLPVLFFLIGNGLLLLLWRAGWLGPPPRKPAAVEAIEPVRPLRAILPWAIPSVVIALAVYALDSESVARRFRQALGTVTRTSSASPPDADPPSQ